MEPILCRCSKYFFCLNQCVIFDRERRPWEPYFFTTIKAVCVAQIYFFLRSLKGQILRQTHGCLMCPGIFFLFLASWFLWSRCTTCTNIRYLVCISSVLEFLLWWTKDPIASKENIVFCEY